jgi:cytochrome P450
VISFELDQTRFAFTALSSRNRVIDIVQQLSFRSPQAYNDIYAPGSRFTKDPTLYKGFGLPKATVGLIDPKGYKERRDTLSPFFSRRAINRLEHVIQEKVSTYTD